MTIAFEYHEGIAGFLAIAGPARLDAAIPASTVRRSISMNPPPRLQYR
jgi:hypothetical protein